MALAGKAAAVFGFASTRSLAWGIAHAWHAAGASVTVGIQSERFRGALERATADWAPPPRVVVCDVSRDEEITRAFEDISRATPRLHAFAHSIAFAPASAMRAPLLQTGRDDFLLAHSVSAYSLIACARAAAPLMRDGSGADGGCAGGSIIALSYLGSQRAAGAYRVMGPAKASLEGCARGLALELGPARVRVNVIAAGPVDTLAARGIVGFADLRQDAISRSPLGRGVTAQDVGATATFLASDAAAAITGQVLHVDGGFSAVV